MAEMMALAPALVQGFRAIAAIIGDIRQSKDKLKTAEDKTQIAEEIDREIEEKIATEYGLWKANLLRFADCLRACKDIADTTSDLGSIVENFRSSLEATKDKNLVSKNLDVIQTKLFSLQATTSENIDPADAMLLSSNTGRVSDRVVSAGTRLDYEDWDEINNEMREAYMALTEISMTFSSRVDQLIDGIARVED